MTTNADRRDEIREHAGIPDWMQGDSGFRARELEEVAAAIGMESYPGSRPMLRQSIRHYLDLTDGFDNDPSGLRTEDYEAILAALEDVEHEPAEATDA